jgi:hypothetical protein
MSAEGKTLNRASMESLDDVRTTILEREFPAPDIAGVLKGDPNHFLAWLRGVYNIYPKRPLPAEVPTRSEFD